MTPSTRATTRSNPREIHSSGVKNQRRFAMQGPKRAVSEIVGRGGVESNTDGRSNTEGARQGSRIGMGAEKRLEHNRKQASDKGPASAARSAGAENDKGRSQHYKTRSRRAILEDTSDEEEEEAGLSAKQPSLKSDQPPPFHDYDIDMQLKNVSPERGGSSLRLSMSNDELVAVPNRAATSRLDNINLTNTTPTSTTQKSPRLAAAIDNHSAKRRRNEEGRHKTPSDSNKSYNMRPKEAIPSIDIVSQMWLGFPIHEAVAVQRGKDIIREDRTNEEFARVGTPHKKS
jgi:hypothetical protein